MVDQADGREVHLGLVYPCLLGARMLGSTIFPWLLTGPSSLLTEDCLMYAFVVLGISLSVIAYDYQVPSSMFLKFAYSINLFLVSDASDEKCRKLQFWCPYFAYSMLLWGLLFLLLQD